jgi:hypothetical protein
MTQTVVKRMVLMFLGLSIVMLAGYAKAEGPVDVTGTWIGNTLRGAATMTMVLQQTGNKVTGTLTGAGTADGAIDGVVDGATIRFRFDDDAYSDTPLLYVKGNEITGMLSGTTITLRRVKNAS